MTRKYTAFTKAFKLEDLHLASQPNTSVAQLARDLGIRRNMIYKWRVELSQKQDKAFKRSTDNVNTPYHKATHSELLKKNKQLEKRSKSCTNGGRNSKKGVSFLQMGQRYYLCSHQTRLAVFSHCD
ncbi:hypothetical protein [uncultured Gammaproteobacteria bacterium]|jgi:transposase|nr:hypothetical protein [uncultured Gammaproteobacteria bacterium]CAC9608904.1 hypothetical protein [uncultured Gammaproteobacteria bacterium]CAC9618638.1 hypothetical protein [uncultured Gammaproteobacteria bacterium]